MKKEQVAPWLILGAGVLWGTSGIFVRHFEAMGFSALQISAIRLSIAAVIFLIGMMRSGKGNSNIDKKDFGWFLLTGVGSVFLMSAFYFFSISYSSMATAAILLYTAPFFVLLASALLFKERITIIKAIALLIAFGGCFLMTGTGETSTLGVVFGLLSGILYASYSIFGTILLKKYSSLTITAICFSLGAVVSLFFCNLPQLILVLWSELSFTTLLWCLGLGVITAAAPFALYTAGLQNTPAGKASILSFAEPMAATVFGTFLLGEPLGYAGATGIILIAISIVLLNLNRKEVN